ncbi:MAG: KH domain-containing protein [Thermoanaerobaculia bacterium]
MSESAVQEALARVIGLIVDEPEEIDLEEIPGRDSTLFELQVAPEDLGKVIGRQGRTARALRSLLAARGSRDGERYELEIIET